MGVIVCSAAGNAGDSYYIHSSPASAGGTLSVAATFNDQAGFISDSNVTANSPGSISGHLYPYLYGVSPVPHVGAGGLTGNVVYGVPNNGSPDQGTGPYTPYSNAAQSSGNICLVDRGGGIGFATKIGRAKASGAIACIVDNFNNPGADPIVMGGLNANDNIPAVMITRSARDEINTAAGGFDATTGLPANPVNVTINNDNAVISHGGAAPDTLPSYSARGPRLPDSAIKPDISAPAEVTAVAASAAEQGLPGFAAA